MRNSGILKKREIFSPRFVFFPDKKPYECSYENFNRESIILSNYSIPNKFTSPFPNLKKMFDFNSEDFFLDYCLFIYTKLFT